MNTETYKKIGSNYNIHRDIMFDIIKKIYGGKVRSNLAFKGGTLLMFAYELDRFSVDLDFDLVKGDIVDIKKEIKNIVNSIGEIKEETNTKIILKYNIDQLPLKIEINQKIKKNDNYEIINFFGIPCLSMTKDCLFANKLVALSERQTSKNMLASRDVYDIWFMFSKHFPINEDLIYERTGKGLKEYLIFIKEFIPKFFSQENILRGLGDLVDNKKKYRIKNNLIKETIGMIDYYTSLPDKGD